MNLRTIVLDLIDNYNFNFKLFDKIHLINYVNNLKYMTTVNKKEIEKFSRMAEEWWDVEGKFKPLHKFNPIRIKYIKESVIENFKLQNNEKLPLKGINLLDIGCGGGLLSEPMCRLGATVTGIDASAKNIEIAKIHAKKNNLNINYICTSPEKIQKEKFDVILNMEIVEHVENVDLFLNSSSNLLKKDGLMFVATINKTLKSYLFAIIGAEYILRWLPIGTHEWEKFIKPDDLKNILSKFDMTMIKTDGVKFNPILDKWSLSKDTSINYISKFIKN